MKDVESAYIAGIIDGEGTVTLTRHHSNERKCPIVSVSSTTLCILDYLQVHFGGSISHHRTYQDHHKQSWSWKVNRNKAIQCLEVVRPFMREPEKIRRADLILSRYKLVTPRNGKYTPELEVARLEFENEFFHPSTP